jgi:hypothetical protein
MKTFNLSKNSCETKTKIRTTKEINKSIYEKNYDTTV